MTRRARFMRFGGVGLGGVAVQLSTMALLVNGLDVHYAAATPVAVAAALVHNFVWHRRWTWRDRRTSGGPLAAFATFVATNGLVSATGNLVAMAVLVGRFGVPAVPANVVAIAVCSVANFALADTLVFARRRAPVRQSHGESTCAAHWRRLLS